MTQKEFYAHMNPLNVHPNPTGKWDVTYGYLTEWKLQGGAGKLVGYSDGGGSHIMENRYWIID